MSKALETFGQDLLDRAKAKVKAQWKDLEQEARDDFEAAIKDYSQLILAGAAGEDVEQDLCEVEATIANWSWVGASYAKRVVLEILHEAAEAAGRFLAAAAERLLKGLT